MQTPTTINEDVQKEYYRLLVLENRERMPGKLRPFLTERRRYKFAHGGRGGAKTVSFSKALLYLANEEQKKILCTREVQNSIRDSVHSQLAGLIDELEYSDYRVEVNSIYNVRTDSEFIFKGLWGQEKTQSVKGLANIDIAWVEEAQAVSKGSLDILIPTIRKAGSELWFGYNPLLPDDPVELLRQSIPDEDKLDVEINWEDNPYLTEVILRDIILSKQAYEEGRSDDYLHIWKGMTVAISDRTIFKKREIDGAVTRLIPDTGRFEVGADIARYGSDRTVFFKRKGMVIKDHYMAQGLSVPEVARRLVNFAGDETKNVKTDDSGVGGGVTDLVQEEYNRRNEGKNFDDMQFVTPINNGSAPKDKDKYNNAISEMWFELKNQISEVSIPDIQELKSELLTREWTIDNHGRRVVESKEAYKKRGYRSPDYADALLLCFYNPDSAWLAWSKV